MMELWDPQHSEALVKWLITGSLKPEGTSGMMLGHCGYYSFNKNENKKLMCD